MTDSNHWSNFPPHRDDAVTVEVSSAQAAAAFDEADKPTDLEVARRVIEHLRGEYQDLMAEHADAKWRVERVRELVDTQRQRSANRIAELADAHGCEASSEREFHQGRVLLAHDILDALGGTAQPAPPTSG